LHLSAFRALPLTDRLLALALQEYEDQHCPDCGQNLKYAMDPDLADEWTTMAPVRDHACTALAQAAEANKDAKHAQALRHPVGMREGWEGRLAATRAAKAPGEPSPR
jgi:hypothetical protein